MSDAQNKLQEILHGLSEGDKKSLLDYAEFLSQRNCSTDHPEHGNAAELLTAVPLKQGTYQNETVIDAVKRLSKNYFMLDKDVLLHKTSALMTAHILQGREAEAVIADLEALFKNEYKNIIKTK